MTMPLDSQILGTASFPLGSAIALRRSSKAWGDVGQWALARTCWAGGWDGSTRSARIDWRGEVVYLSTLRRYVAALGGELEVNAVFPDRTVTLVAAHR